MFALPNKMTENVTEIMRKLIKMYDFPSTVISDNTQEFTSEAIKIMRITWQKKARSGTLLSELKWSCREGKLENPQNSQNLLRRT